MTFLNSILNNSKEHEDPFKHWELNEPLSNEAIQEIIKADIPNVTDHNLNYDACDYDAVMHMTEVQDIIHWSDGRTLLSKLIRVT